MDDDKELEEYTVLTGAELFAEFEKMYGKDMALQIFQCLERQEIGKV